VQELPTFPLSLFSSFSFSRLPFAFSLLILNPLDLDSSDFFDSQHVHLYLSRFSLATRRVCCLWERIINSLFELCKGWSRLDVLLLERPSEAREQRYFCPGLWSLVDSFQSSQTSSSMNRSGPYTNESVEHRSNGPS